MNNENKYIDAKILEIIKKHVPKDNLWSIGMAEELQTYMTERTTRENQIQEINDSIGQKVIDQIADLASGRIHFGDTLNNIFEGVHIIGFDWRYLYVNDSYASKSYYKKNELIGRNMLEMYTGIENTEMFRVLKQSMDERVLQHIESEFVYPDNRRVWFELSIQPVKEGILVFSTDISERKNAEQRLQNSELEYRSLIEQATDGIFISDENGRYVDVNISACNMLGYSKNELLQLTVNDILLLEDVKNNPPRLSELMSGKSILSLRNLKKKDNSIVPVEINAKMLTNGRMLGIVRDITERKEIEDKLALFASIVNTSNDAIISKSLDGIITSWNYGAEKIFGYSANEAIGNRISILIPPHLQNEEAEIMNKIRKGEFVDHYETTRIRKNGQLIAVSLTISPIKDSLGNIIGASKISQDISEKKAAEEKLLISEKRFRHTLDNMLEGVQIHDFDWRYTYVNDSLVKYSKYKREELIGFTVMEKYPGIEQTPLFQVMQKCMYERVTEHLITEFVFPDGSLAYFELSIQPVLEGIFILSIDITERKKAEESVRKLNEELELKVAERTFLLEQNIRQLKESEERFQKAFQASAAGIAITSLVDTTYSDVNDAFIQMTGYSKEELIGHSSVELDLIVNFEQREKVLRQIMEYGSAKHFEMSIRHKSGRILDVLSSAEVIILNGEKYAINIIFDITDRKRAEEELRKSDALFSSLFEQNPTSLAISSVSNAAILNVNESFLHLFGFGSKREVIGNTAKDLNIMYNPEHRNEILMQLTETNKVVNLEGPIRTKHGEKKWVSTSVIKIEVNNEPCLLAVILDITERKKAEEQLEAVNKELEAFTYSVSHDLRAPLRAVSGYAQMLNEDYSTHLDEEGQRVIRVIKSNAAKMGTLIDDLLAFSRLGRKELKKTKVDMNQLIVNVMVEINKSMTNVADIKIGSLHIVEADYSLLYQVVFNLVANAIKYSSKKKRPVVEIASEELDNEIVFSVKDNGAGFDMQYVDKLFGVFQRLHSQEEFEGTGVGLAMVQRVIAKHGGKVWAEGRVDEGASFYFSLRKN